MDEHLIGKPSNGHLEALHAAVCYPAEPASSFVRFSADEQADDRKDWGRFVFIFIVPRNVKWESPSAPVAFT